MSFIQDTILPRLLSPTPTGKSENPADSVPSLSDARLVCSLGPALSGDRVTAINPPPLSENSWVYFETINGTEFPRPTLAIPNNGSIIQVYFPADTVKKPLVTAVYTITRGTLGPGSPASCVIQHNLDLQGSQILVIDKQLQTRRGFSYGDHKRENAYAMIADNSMAMKIILPRGGDEFHYTYDPTQTGKKRMSGMMNSRAGNRPPWAEEGVSHVYYRPENGKLVDWETEEDERSEVD